MKIDLKLSMVNESVSNGVYFFKDTGKKPKAHDRVTSKYDGSQFISDVGRQADEIYEATSITIFFEGKRTKISCSDIAPGLGRIKVCVRNGANNYEWKYLY
jgi:hypothetical protein